MSKVLITGFSGFVGRHFLHFLYENKIDWEVIGIDIERPIWDYSFYNKCFYRQINLLNIDNLGCVLREEQPDYILHLASYSSVAYSWEYPAKSYVNNTNIFLNLVESIRAYAPHCRMLSVGSSEEYGNVQENDLPITEELQLNPISPYAVARVSQEMLSRIYCDNYGINIIMTRSFNHIGPWQDERFVIPSFIKRIEDVRKTGNGTGVIEVGDTSVVRDFVDVRDVVKAYYLLLKEGNVGDIYNICSGRGMCLHEVIQLIAAEYGVSISEHINPLFVRPNDNKIVIGSYEKMRKEFGWEPTYSIQETLHDMILERNE